MTGLQRGFYQEGELEGEPQAHMIKSHQKCSSPIEWMGSLPVTTVTSSPPLKVSAKFKQWQELHQNRVRSRTGFVQCSMIELGPVCCSPSQFVCMRLIRASRFQPE
jgi:hypothetical protein